MEELAAEEEAEEAKKQAKKGKNSKAKSKRTQGGNGSSGGGGGGASAAAAAAATTAAAATAEAGLFMVSLTAATGRLAIGEDEEEKENSHVEANPPTPAAAKNATPSSLLSGNDDDEEEHEADYDEEKQDQGQEGAQQRRWRKVPQGGMEEAGARVVDRMSELSLKEEEKAGVASRAAANAHAPTMEVADGGDRKLAAPASVLNQPLEESPASKANLEEEKLDFFFDGAPDGLKCSVGFCLMTEAVVALDGFSYQKSSLDEHIAHCAAKGQPLTSPLTGELMDAIYILNQNARTFVKEYIDQREKEWALHLEQRRAERAKTGK